MLCPCVCVCVCVSKRAVVPNSCFIPSLGMLAGPNLINSVCGGRGRVLSAGSNVMSQCIMLMGRLSNVCVCVCVYVGGVSHSAQFRSAQESSLTNIFKKSSSSVLCFSTLVFDAYIYFQVRTHTSCSSCQLIAES